MKNVTKVAYCSAVTMEAIVKLAKSSSASDFTYYICRIFGIALPLPVAVAVRILLLTTGGFALLDGLKKLSPELSEKVK